jgi:hypothetical protein
MARLLLLLLALSKAERSPTWSPTPCSLAPAATADQPRDEVASMSAWFVDAGSKV